MTRLCSTRLTWNRSLVCFHLQTLWRVPASFWFLSPQSSKPIGYWQVAWKSDLPSQSRLVFSAPSSPLSSALSVPSQTKFVSSILFLCLCCVEDVVAVWHGEVISVTSADRGLSARGENKIEKTKNEPCLAWNEALRREEVVRGCHPNSFTVSFSLLALYIFILHLDVYPLTWVWTQTQTIMMSSLNGFIMQPAVRRSSSSSLPLVRNSGQHPATLFIKPARSKFSERHQPNCRRLHLQQDSLVPLLLLFFLLPLMQLVMLPPLWYFTLSIDLNHDVFVSWS